jgi:hypothetical protein
VTGRIRARSRAALVLLAASLALAAPGPVRALAAEDPEVTVIVHVPLDAPRPLATGVEWYCANPRTYLPGPTPAATFGAFEERFRALGPAFDRFGFGSWMAGRSGTSDLAFLAYDHVFIRTHLAAARRFLPGFLHDLRTQLHQREALAEIAGGSYPDLGEARLRLDVVIPYARADYRTLRALHLIFGDNGRSGASQYADEGGVHVYSSVALEAVERIERALSEAGFRSTASPSTFIADDAPSCPP